MSYSRPVAYHEAGHTIAARALGLRVLSTEVTKKHRSRRAGIGGRTERPACNSSDRQELIYLLAGPIAETRHTKRSLAVAMLEGLDEGGSDLRQIEAILNGCPEHHRDEIYRQVEKQARQLVKDRWEDIGALAGRLVQEGVVA